MCEYNPTDGDRSFLSNTKILLGFVSFGECTNLNGLSGGSGDLRGRSGDRKSGSGDLRGGSGARRFPGTW